MLWSPDRFPYRVRRATYDHLPDHVVPYATFLIGRAASLFEVRQAADQRAQFVDYALFFLHVHVLQSCRVRTQRLAERKQVSMLFPPNRTYTFQRIRLSAANLLLSMKTMKMKSGPWHNERRQTDFNCIAKHASKHRFAFARIHQTGR